MLILNLQRNAITLGVKKVEIINPGCNYPIPILNSSKDFARNIYKNASPKIITISRLDGRKSHHNILMTLKNILPKYPNLKYVSIGDGDERKNLEKLRDELGIENSVKFIFRSTEQEKVALLQQSDIFLMPSVVYKKSVEDSVFPTLKQHRMENPQLEEYSEAKRTQSKVEKLATFAMAMI